MSVLTVTPEVVSVAAGDLSGIGSTISEANVVAAAPTLGVVAPAADSVSAELAALFGGHAETYQAVSAQGQVFHQEFVNALSTSSAAYARGSRQRVRTGQGARRRRIAGVGLSPTPNRCGRRIAVVAAHPSCIVEAGDVRSTPDHPPATACRPGPGCGTPPFPDSRPTGFLHRGFSPRTTNFWAESSTAREGSCRTSGG